MKLAGEVFNGGDDAGRGAIHGVADDSEMMVAHGFEDVPAGAIGEDFKFAGSGVGMRFGKDEVFGPQAHDFFEAHLRPVLSGLDDAGGVGFAEGVGNKRVFANGNQGLCPDNEENPAWRNCFKSGVQRGEARLEVGDKRFPRFRDAEEIGEFLRGGENFVDVASVGGVGGDAESVESADGVQAVDLLGDENEIRVEGGDFLDIRIDGASDFRLLLGVGRIVAIVGIADEAVLDA